MRSRLPKILTAVLAIAIVWLLCCGALIWRFGHRDFAQSADCAIVLGAAVYGAKPSPVFEERIRHAIHLHQQGVVAKLLFTGGVGEGTTHAESHVAAHYAEQAGIPQSAILAEAHSHTTQQNLAEAKKLMEARGFRSAIIVSDPLHLKRSALMAKRLGLHAVTSPTPTSRYRSTSARLKFLLREVYFYHHYLFTGH